MTTIRIADRFELWPVEDLVPYERNSRVHDPDQVDGIAASIAEFGFLAPIVVDTQRNRIAAGHGRLLAARRLGMDRVPVVAVDHLTEAQFRAYVIADNKHTDNSRFDEAVLAAELAALRDEEFDLSTLGFTDEELAALLPDLEEEADGGEPTETDPDAVPEPPPAATSERGDVWRLGKHRLLCGDSLDLVAVEAMMAGELADLVVTDPPYNVDYKGKTAEALTIANDAMDDDEFYQFLRDAYATMFAVSRPGAPIYVFHADSEGVNFRRALQDAGWLLKQCCIWVKDTFVLGRQDYHWQHEPCQPAGTMVRTPNGEMPIESLKDGDRVVSYDPYSGTITGMRDGRAVKVATRHYRGDLYGVRVGDRITWATDSHKFTVRFHDSSRAVWCTYLMRRGKWWRVGITKTYDARGFGLKNRFKTERADEAWIITTHTNRLDALCMEQILSVGYGIPRTHWTTERGAAEGNCRTKEHIERIYSSLDLEKMERNANDLLEAHGRRRRFPFLTRDNLSQKCSTRVTVQVQACNLIPEIMSVPIPYAKWDGLKTFDWEPIDAVERRPHDGPVYSLDVEKDKHYIADGIVTHNCLYGWKPGAAHTWAGDRKQTTVWEFARPKRNAEHPTMKPVELIRYPIENSSEPGAVVLDLFGGSGSTLIACEQTGRRARLVELDPRYADVIVTRWQALTGRQARLDETGETFAEVAARRAAPRTVAPAPALQPAVPFFQAGQPFVAANDPDYMARKRA